MKIVKPKFILTFFFCLFFTFSGGYPIDGYEYSRIRRLLRLQEILDGKTKEAKPLPGMLKSINDIQLNLLGKRGDSLETLPAPDLKLQKAINGLFPGLNESYSVTILDITEGRPTRLAQRQENRGYQPGSVGKLAVLTGLFVELEKIYPESFEDRITLLCNRFVKAGAWGLTDSHTVPHYNPETKEFKKRTVIASDIFSLFEWADHMVSVSNNGAASILWREVVLMRVFGDKYPNLTQEEADQYFKETPKNELSTIANEVVNQPLRELGIGENEWRLGSFFTRGASGIIPGKGGSIGSTLGLMKYLIAMERGKIVDQNSSLEIKRLLYQTDRRIRYASSPALKEAAVYFKSGSLYKCKPEVNFKCGKYMGNVDNYMNSVAIVEQPNGATYIVCLMSNVLRKNSNLDHLNIATSIDRIMK
ncbi:MAG: hypothetical protein DWP98_13775 [Bacteroidetes bacterium]|nr:MAG: hypothetical protein DWP98_13775 [Bacteroidota bacterium]MBL1144607.1 hypothetical protein [Bacteroidota bacterium]NOG57402.1 hypothetical protein [Bacteroidota bacterium]